MYHKINMCSLNNKIRSSKPLGWLHIIGFKSSFDRCRGKNSFNNSSKRKKNLQTIIQKGKGC